MELENSNYFISIENLSADKNTGEEDIDILNNMSNLNLINENSSMVNSNGGGIKIGINKKDYDLYISQLKDKNINPLIRTKNKLNKKDGRNKNNYDDSSYY
ncbi:hypothetical protein PFTANZ_01154, partial [Plasmodium falciparum Tanzania (2000708)]